MYGATLKLVRYATEIFLVVVLLGLADQLKYVPGTSYEYSNVGYSLLAASLEEVSGDEDLFVTATTASSSRYVRRAGRITSSSGWTWRTAGSMESASR